MVMKALNITLLILFTFNSIAFANYTNRKKDEISTFFKNNKSLKLFITANAVGIAWLLSSIYKDITKAQDVLKVLLLSETNEDLLNIYNVRKSDEKKYWPQNMNYFVQNIKNKLGVLSLMLIAKGMLFFIINKKNKTKVNLPKSFLKFDVGPLN